MAHLLGLFGLVFSYVHLFKSHFPFFFLFWSRFLFLLENFRSVDSGFLILTRLKEKQSEVKTEREKDEEEGQVHEDNMAFFK